MSERASSLGRHLRRRALVKLIAKVGMAKLAGVGAAAVAVPLVLLALLAVLAGGSSSAEGASAMSCAAVGDRGGDPPARYRPIYAAAAAEYRLGPRGPGILAAIHYVESDFGRTTLPGVRPGTSNWAGAAGPMQFLYPSSWDAFGVDGDGDGVADVYDPVDAIFAAANLLRAEGAPGDWYHALFTYNHADWYVRKVERNAERLGGEVVCRSSALSPVGGSAALQRVVTLYQPRAFRTIPTDLWIGAGSPQAVDARLWPNVVWLLRTFHLAVTAARETGHNTHGDGTAIDVVPQPGKGWDATARAAAETLGWRESCGASGTAPVCPLAPAIQFVGYNGYPSHGDPAHAGGNAHLHVSWQSSSFASSALSPPAVWVRAFPLTE